MSQPPPGYDPTISALPVVPDVPIKAMMGGLREAIEANGEGTNGMSEANGMGETREMSEVVEVGEKDKKTEHTTVIVLGEPYRIRKNTEFPLEDEEERLLKAFQLSPKARKTLGNTMILNFFHALVEFSCDKEAGVLLNPKCEPVRAILRAALMESFLENIPANLLDEDSLRRRNKLNIMNNIAQIGLKPGQSVLDGLLSGLRPRYKINSEYD